MPDGVALPPFGGAEAGDDASRRRRSGLDDIAVRPYSTAAGDDASRRRRSGLGSARASWHVRCSSFLAPARQQHDADRQAAVAGRSKPSGRWVDGPEQPRAGLVERLRGFVVAHREREGVPGTKEYGL